MGRGRLRCDHRAPGSDRTEHASQAGGGRRGAGGCQVDTALGSVKQARAQQNFELRNRLGQRRLRHVQSGSGVPEMKLFGHGDKLSPQAQLNQMHWHDLNSRFIHMPCILIQT